MTNLETGSAPDCGMPATILVIDGDSARMAETAHTLAQARFSVVTGSPEAARGLVLHHAPHLALVEVEDGGGAAAELAFELKRELSSLFVAEVSSAGWRAHRQEGGGGESAADSQLIRPFREHELLDRVEDFLRLRQARRSLARSQQENRQLQETRRYSAEILRASEDRYRAIVETFDGSIYICSQEYRITFMNEELIRRRGNAVGEFCFKALHDLEEVCPWCVNPRVFGGEVVRWEVKSPKDGRWYYVVNSPIRHGDGTVSKQAMIHDITQFKLAEEDLKLKSFTLDNLNEEIFWLSCDNRVLDVNQTACAKLGYSREELLALAAWDIDASVPAEAYPKYWEKLKEIGSMRFETQHRTKDGRLFPVEVTATYLKHNGLEYNCSVVRDITERKNLKKALQESEELFRTLCHAAPIGIFRCDTHWNNIYCNPRWEEISGMSAGDGAGNGWVSTIHPDDLADLLRVRAEAELGGHGYTHEHRKLMQNGGVRWVRVLVNPIKGFDGAVTGYVGTMEDITELRQARQELLKAQKLESIGLLAGGIAHDFNNILTAVLGNISLARFQIKDPDKVDQRLKDAESAAARARDLTQQLLTFARGGEPIKKVLRLPAVLKEAAAFVLHGSNVVCEFRLAQDLWPLEADEGQLVQVLHNLVINAVQAMPEGGTITIGADNLHSCPGEERVEIRVSDTGTGIPEAHLEKIFDPYFTTKQQGSGLGLASCYSIIKKHGGTIRAESALGRGTTFRLELPASTQHLCAAPEASAPLCAGSCRVLVMDDEEIVRTLACDILEQLGYRSDGVGDGKEAVELYRAAREAGTPYAAVILDLTVPGGVGGKDALRTLLELDPEVKGIVCSGYSTDPVMANFREYGFLAVLSKPYRPQDLSRVLKEVLGEPRPELPVAGAPLAAVAAK